jgi:hypothetical protein
LVREGKKQLFLATVTVDSPICQAPGMAGECNSMRNAVTDGYDPYQAWVQLACGTGGGGWGTSTTCLNELGYQWNCGNAPCPELMVNGGDMLGAVSGGVEAMGGRAVLGGWRSAVQRPALVETLAKYAAKGTGTAIDGFNSLGRKLFGACSFSGDTPVLMADGTSKPISEIKVGDEVLATDPETGESGAREVTRLWVHDDEVVKLEVNDDELITTEDHPFWNATDQQWQRADELDRGDALLTNDGSKAVVGRLGVEDKREVVYNLTVAAIHTYYVLAGNRPVLVHNTACPTFGMAKAPNFRGVYIIVMKDGKAYVGSSGKELTSTVHARLHKAFTDKNAAFYKAGYTYDDVDFVTTKDMTGNSWDVIRQAEQEAIDGLGGLNGAILLNRRNEL